MRHINEIATLNDSVRAKKAPVFEGSAGSAFTRAVKKRDGD
jgi:hypothetical protein